MELKAGVRVRNVFNIEIRDAVTEELKGQYEAFNTVTDTLINMLVSGTTSQYLAYIAFGTGTGTPAMTDTKLFTATGVKGCTTVSSDNSLPILSVTRTIRLAAAEFIGSQFTEVGFSGSTLTSGLQTHAMIVDSEQMPIAITKSATDIIDIYATIYFELLEPSGDLAGAAQWKKITNFSAGSPSPLYNTLLGNSWGSTIELHDVEPVGNEAFGQHMPDINTSKGAAITADTTANTKKYSLRFIETEANHPIKAITFNGILVFDTQKAAAIWAGKTYTSLVVATADGIAKSFDLAHLDAKALTLYFDGVAVPPEMYTHNPKKYSDFQSNVAAVSAIGADPTLQVRGTIVKHPTDQSLFVMYATVTREIIVFKLIGDDNPRAEILYREPYTLFSNTTSGNHNPSIAFLDDDVVVISRGGGPSYYTVRDFNPVTGEIGTIWTQHANMPHYVYDHGGVATHRAAFTRIPGSSFALFRYTEVDIAWYPAATYGSELYSVSLNKVTKVIGENVNISPRRPNGHTSLRHMAVNPVRDLLLTTEGKVSGSYTYFYFVTYPFEKATGVFGAPVPSGPTNTYVQYDYSRYMRRLTPTWHPDGLKIYATENGYSNAQNWDSNRMHMFKYDPIAGTVLQDTTYVNAFPSYSSTDGGYYHIEYVDGLFFGLSNEGRVDFGAVEDTKSILYGSYIASGYNIDYQESYYGSPKHLAVLGDYVVGIVDNKGSSSLEQVPIIFWKKQHVAANHIEFASPPANGVVLTASYHVDYIPKDTNHLLDLAITYSFMGA